MPFIELELLFSRSDNCAEQRNQHDFELTSGISSEVDDLVDEYLDEGWTFDDYGELSNEGFKESWSLDQFDDIEDFADFADRVEELGEGYELRCADLMDTDVSMDEYQGCWHSEEEFVQESLGDCFDIPKHLEFYIDWEKLTRDTMMDYSSYEGDDGYHIFRD